MLDGSNKGRWSTKGELLMFRDVDEQGEVRLRVLGIIFIKPDDLAELKRLGLKPFGHQAQWNRIRGLMQERHCDDKHEAKNFLPSCMRTMVQMCYDGASVNHSLHSYVKDMFLSDLLPGVDDCHQIERAAVHALRTEGFAATALAMIAAVVKVFRKKELLVMECAAANKDWKTLKKIYKGRWMQGIFAALSVFLNNYTAMTVDALRIAAHRKGNDWNNIRQHWADVRFLEMVVGLLDISEVLKTAEKKLQDPKISYVHRDEIHDAMQAELRKAVDSGRYFSAFVAQCQTRADKVVFRGIALKAGGTMKGSLRRIRDVLVKEMVERFANRGILNNLQWLNVACWPLDPSELAVFGMQDIKAVFNHWALRFPWLRWIDVRSEFDQVKTVFLQSSQPVNPDQFWKSIISNKATFPSLHVFLRCCLAVSPSDAVVESAFSRLTQLLSPQRLSIEPTLVEQYMILALDSLPWEEYDFNPVWLTIANNLKRSHFRTKRSDRGGVKRGVKRPRTDADSHSQSGSTDSGSDSSSSSSSSSSSDSD